jgi:hypothetical protein
MPPGSNLRARLGLAAAGIVSLTLVAGDAAAAPEVTHWSAYLRAQPSESAAVIDEIPHGALINVGACSGEWCQVINGVRGGWIDKDALTLPTPPRGGAPTTPPDCASAGQAAGRTPEIVRFCHTKPPGS